MPTIATLFSGGEGVGCGARAAGLRHLWGIEIDDAVAQVARDNGFNVETADIIEVDPTRYETPTVLHASPPCPSFSVAKQGRRETDDDIRIAQATARFIEELRPQYFTLENVWGYRKAESWAIIRDALNRCGYWFDLAHVNAADFGGPQTRKRMIIRAALGQMVPQLPAPEPWVGWHAAVEDLIPTLPDSEFAPWQLARMSTKLRESLLVDSAGYLDGVVTRHRDEPANTIIANHSRRPMRAFLIGSQNAGQKWNSGIKPEDTPAMTITAKQEPRAILVGGANTSKVQAAPGVGVSQPDEPTRTVTCTNSVAWRAVLVGGQYARPASEGSGPRPAQTRDASEPAFTVTTRNKGDWRGQQTPGRIVQMTPRALARFQAFPDSYRLTGNRRLDCKVIGMAVPPMLYEKLVGQLINTGGTR